MHLHNAFRDEEIKPLWVSRGTSGIHAQYTNVGVYTDYDSVMAYHSGRPSPVGKLILHMTNTPVIEVAEDGKTAKGFWLMNGLESGTTDPANVGAMPENLYEPADKNVQGKRVWAHWVWCQYALDFLLQDGQWKIWHFRCLEVARAPYHENWISFAEKNQFAFDKVRPCFPWLIPAHCATPHCADSSTIKRIWLTSATMEKLYSCPRSTSPPRAEQTSTARTGCRSWRSSCPSHTRHSATFQSIELSSTRDSR